MIHVAVKGTGSHVPDNIISNDDLSKLVDTSDEWIKTRTGIENRRISKTENTSQMAYKAAKRALERAHVSPSEVELIICATITPDSFTPSTACILQDLLGASKAVAFDLSAACTGFIYGISVASQFIRTGTYKNAVVIGAEALSKVVDWSDRSTCVLFGDGAGAVYLEGSEEETGIIDLELTTDGSKRDLLVCTGLPLNSTDMSNEATIGATVGTLMMQGGDVFKFAVKTIVDYVNEFLKKHNLDMSDIKTIFPHQANIRIIEAAAKMLRVPMDKFYVNLQNYGNTSSASIGLALDEASRKGLIQPKDKVILVGFGGGMTSGAILLEWANIS